jgi:4-amino-4-deoxy-L-arabinose transferase-like glycosyltransferase
MTRTSRLGSPWLAVLLVLALVAVIRVRLLSFPLERDEGEYAYAGQLILQGIPPYDIAYNMKLPGTYAAYALILAMFGQTTEGIHLGLLMVNGAAIVLMFLLGRRLFGPLVGVVAAGSYAVMSVSPSVMGTAAHATQFVVLAALGGTLLLLEAIDAGRIGKLLASGFLLGLAFVMKQHGIFFPVFGALYLAWELLRRRRLGKRAALSRCAAFVASVALPFGLTCLILWWAGVFEKFWFWTFSYAHAYVSIIPPGSAAGELFKQLPKQLGAGTPIWILAGIGLPLAFWKNHPGGCRPVFVATFLSFSLFAVCPGFYFRPHYFVLLLPAVALLAGLAVGALPRTRNTWIPACVFSAAVLLSLLQQRAFFFEMTPLEACRAVYALNPFPEAVVVGRFIADTTPPDARIAVLGSEPEIYFHARRRSATGYLYTFPMTEKQPYALTMQRDLIREIETSRPDVLVFSPIWASDVTRMSLPQVVNDWLGGYLRGRYDPVGLADVVSADRTDYAWGSDAGRQAPKATWYLFVLRRK